VLSSAWARGHRSLACLRSCCPGVSPSCSDRVARSGAG
jgi:hypothetical protein